VSKCLMEVSNGHISISAELSGHFGPETLWHRNILALVLKCLDSSFSLQYNTVETVRSLCTAILNSGTVNLAQ